MLGTNCRIFLIGRNSRCGTLQLGFLIAKCCGSRGKFSKVVIRLYIQTCNSISFPQRNIRTNNNNKQTKKL